MKKFLAIVLAGLMLISISACGSKPAAEPTPAPAAPADTAEPAPDAATPAPADNGEKPYIAVVSKGFQHQFWQVVKKGADQAAADLGVEITFDGPPTESDIAIQVDMLKSAMDKKPAAVCLAALDTESVKEQLQACKDNGIPVVGFDSGVPNAPEGSIYATASTDNSAAAAIAAEQLYADAGFQAKLAAATPEAPINVAVLSQDATSDSIISRTSGFINKLVELVGDDSVKIVGHDKYAKDAASAKVIVNVNVPATTSAADPEDRCRGAARPRQPRRDLRSNENAAAASSPLPTTATTSTRTPASSRTSSPSALTPARPSASPSRTAGSSAP